MFGPRLPLKLLADWCWSFGNALRAGISIVDALKLTSRRGRPRMRALNEQIRQKIEAGDDLSGALRSVGEAFPPLFLAMADVAGHTGRLPEVLRALEGYFRFQLRLRRQFLTQIFWPVIQLVAAILVVALLIYILGIIAEGRGGQTIDFLGLGLHGSAGATAWLAGWFGVFSLLAGGNWFVRRGLGQTRALDSLLLRIPVLGECLRLLAMTRFCFAMRMTLDSGMSILLAIRLSLEATDNGAFTGMIDDVVTGLEEGHGLYDLFAPHRVFPDEFLEVLHSAEQSGTVPEAMGRLSEQFGERAEHQLVLLNTALGWGVWCLVAALIIFLVFRIFSTYVAVINQFATQ